MTDTQKLVRQVRDLAEAYAIDVRRHFPLRPMVTLKALHEAIDTLAAHRAQQEAECEVCKCGLPCHPNIPCEEAAAFVDSEPSPTAGMSLAQRILHVGGRNNAAGYVEFGSIQAVEALVRQVLRDLPAATSELLPDHADHVPEIAARLRRVARIAGVADRVPEDDATAVGCIFSVLGRMAEAMARKQAATSEQGARDAMLRIASDALDEIALAGMSGTGQETEEGMRDWHARQAWKFIRIAATAKASMQEAAK